VVTRLQKELKQTKPFPSPEEELYLSLVRTSELLSQGIFQLFKQADLTPTQYNALRILRGAGAEGASCTEISDRMITRDSDITRLLDRLEARGLISREREAKDRRRIQTHITEQGLKLISELDGPVTEYHRRQLGFLGEKKIANLSKLLEEIRSSLD
jgi:DNA-binding MarR family transcriptional regulator